MFLIVKRAEPRELVHARMALRTTSGAMNNYEGLDGMTRRAVVDSLLTEQGYLCAYCMRRIGDDAKIEHYLVRHPTSAYRENMRAFMASGSMSGDFDPDYDADAESLDYRNMLAVCDGGSGGPLSAHTCDVARNDGAYQSQPLCVNPLSPVSMDKVRYSSNGRIWSDDQAVDHDLEQVLRLNGGHSLMANRKAALDKLRQNVATFCQKHPHRPKREYCASIHKQIVASEHKPPYAGILLWQLEKWMR